MERKSNLDELIYMSVFSRPKYKLEISKEIYGKEVKQIYPVIEKLEENKWIRRVKKGEKLNIGIIIDIEDENYPFTKEKDKRAKRRQYYFANLKPLYDTIIEKLKNKNIILTPDEIKKLEIYLNDIFRSRSDRYIKKIDLKEISEGLSVLLELLSWDCKYAAFIKEAMQETLTEDYNKLLTLKCMMTKEPIIKNKNDIKEYQKFYKKYVITKFLQQKLKDKYKFSKITPENLILEEEVIFKHLGISLMNKLSNLSYKSDILEEFLSKEFLKFDINISGLILYLMKKKFIENDREKDFDKLTDNFDISIKGKYFQE